MDFRVVHDDEFFHYSQLHDLLDGRGVHNINETYQKVVYQPLHAPFEKIVNTATFEDFIDAKKASLVIKIVDTNLQNFLEEVKNYASGGNQVQEVKKEILEMLESSINLKERKDSLNFEEKQKKILTNIIPEDDFEWGILFSWIFIHPIGKITSKENYELISRSWIDEWQLSKYIELTLDGLKKDDKEKSWEASTLIKVLVSQQNLLYNFDSKEMKSSTVLKKLFTNSDAQQYLNINRYKETLWLNAEAFFNFCDWIGLISLIKILSSYGKGKAEKKIGKILNIIEDWKQYSKQAEFKVKNIIELVEK
jgi:hypothetical protein